MKATGVNSYCLSKAREQFVLGLQRRPANKSIQTNITKSFEAKTLLNL